MRVRTHVSKRERERVCVCMHERTCVRVCVRVCVRACCDDEYVCGVCGVCGVWRGVRRARWEGGSRVIGLIVE